MSAILTTIGHTIVFRLSDNSIGWTSGMAICGDGSPRCYHPDSKKGLDALGNAGTPGNWYGIATDPKTGNPFIQGVNAPPFSKETEGFYVSQTAFIPNPELPPNDPHRYLNAETMPYIVIPGHFMIPNLLGKRAMVINLENHRFSMAVVGEIGPKDKIGEGSIALANVLGIDPDCRNGGVSEGIHYIIYS